MLNIDIHNYIDELYKSHTCSYCTVIIEFFNFVPVINKDYITVKQILVITSHKIILIQLDYFGIVFRH